MGTEPPPKTKRPKLKATQRTLKALRDRGYTADVCEKRVYIKPGNVTHGGFDRGFTRDLFEFADVLVYKPDVSGVWAIQSTSRQAMSEHLKKYRRNPQVTQKIRDWLACGNRFAIIGWDYVMVPKVKGSGLKGVWKLCEKAVKAEMLEPNAADLAAIKVNQELAEIEGRRKAAKRKANQTKRLPQPYRKGKDDG